MEGISPETIEHALSVARENDFEEVSLRLGEFEFRARLLPAAKRKPIASIAAVDPEPEAITIKAGLVGRYRQPSSEVKSGMTLEKGADVGAIVALNIENKIDFTYFGEVLEVLVKDNDPVEYGQPILRLKQ